MEVAELYHSFHRAMAAKFVCMRGRSDVNRRAYECHLLNQFQI